MLRVKVKVQWARGKVESEKEVARQVGALTSVTQKIRQQSDRRRGAVREVPVHLLVFRAETLEHVKIPRAGSSRERSRWGRRGKTEFPESGKTQSTHGPYAGREALLAYTEQKGREIRCRCRNVQTRDGRKRRESQPDGSHVPCDWR